ncbi:MAG TPA: glycosyltransferase family 39 protein [Candidatus Acidoferrales bacterium]|nr:glycosyltransferase family 39 protein [Candidatus Acidoferrales bacterium]
MIPIAIMSRRYITLLAAGLLVMLAGMDTLAHHDAVAGFLDARFGQRIDGLVTLLHDVLPRGVAFGLGLTLLGAWLLALAIGAPTEAGTPKAHALQLAASSSGLRRWAYAICGLTIALAAVTVGLLRGAAPGSSAVVLWVATLAAGLVTAALLDRARRTPFGNPFCRWEAMAVLSLSVLDLLLVSYDLGDWHWSGTPDESYFFTTAQSLLTGTFNGFLLSEHGVFGYHPVLSSAYQAAFMRLFGANAFGWRLSSAVALAVALLPLYVLGRELWNRRTGFIAAALCGSAPLAVTFAHFGYNNAQVYPVVTGSLALAAWSTRRQSVAGCFAAGCLAGLGFFTFYSARLTPVFIALLLWSVRRWGARRPMSAALVAVAAGIVLGALPLLTHPVELAVHMFQQTGVAPAQSSPPGHASAWTMLATAVTVVPHVLKHWLLATLYVLWINNPTHFQTNPPADGVSAALATVGLWLGLRATMRGAAATRFLFLAYLAAALLGCATSPYDNPPMTRLMLLPPFTALLAAVALDALMRSVASATRRPRLAAALGTALAASAVAGSTLHVRDTVYRHGHGYGDGTTSELIRLAQSLPTGCRIVYIQTEQTYMYDVNQILSIYGLDAHLQYIKPFGVEADRALKEITPPFLVAYDLRKREEIDAVEQTLQARFPEIHWQDSARGETWNLRYFLCPSALRVGLPVAQAATASRPY